MRRDSRIILVCGLVTLLGVLSAVQPLRAEDTADAGGGAVSYEGGDARPAYPEASGGVMPAGTSSGGIIGYKPITESALESAMNGGQPQPGAQGQAVGNPQPAAGAAGGGAEGDLSMMMYQASMMVGDGVYTLGRDDIVRINVRGQPDFSGNFMVGFDGRGQYNYLGDIPVAGLTKYELQQVLEKLLERYIRVPVVNVQLVGYNSKVVYVIGEVNRPGKFIMRGDTIKLREAVLAAGLPNRRAALGRVHVIKPDQRDPMVRVINLKRILYKGKLKDDVELVSGEVVVVPSTVLSKVNDFLTALISPVTRAASVAALASL